MRVLFCVRPDLIDQPGGDTVQILKTKKYLEKIGVSIDISYDLNLTGIKYDLVHLFNLIQSDINFKYIKYFNSENIPVVISPIYWDTSEYENKVLNQIIIKRKIVNYLFKSYKTKEHFSGIFKNLCHQSNLNPFSFSRQKYCLEKAELILPNSQSEVKSIEDKFNIFNKYAIVPNGIDENIVPDDYDKIQVRYCLPDKFILCVGRIEYRKNQLDLIKAAKELGLNLVLIGNINPSEKKYWKTCNKYFDKSIYHIPYLRQEELCSLYRRASVHVLPSWFETPGLVSLEAINNGCQIVTTDRGSTKEYFGKYAFYCQPDNYLSVKEAIEQSLSNPKLLNEFKEIILQKYTWQKAANDTFKGYEQVLSKI